MRRPEYSTQFRRDVKRVQKRGKDTEKLKTLIELITAATPLPAKYRDHPLKNDWAGYRDAHLEPDWLLIYFATDEIVRFERTGSHADLLE